MDSDREDFQTNSPDDLKHTVYRGIPELGGKSVGCSSLMMKNFESSSSLLKLGMGRAVNLGSQETVNRSVTNTVNDDSLSMFLSSTMQPNIHSDFQKNFKEQQNEFNLFTGNTNSIKNIKNTRLANTMTNIGNGNVTRNRKSNNIPPEFDTVEPNTSSYKNHLKLSNFNMCTVLGKPVSSGQPVMGRSYSSSNHGGKSSLTLTTPMMHSYFTQCSEERHSKETSENSNMNNREVTEEIIAEIRHDLEPKHMVIREAPESNNTANTSQYYSKVFDNSDESLSLLKKMFVSSSNINAAKYGSKEVCEELEEPISQIEKFEWIPTEPTEVNSVTTKGDIEDLFEDNFEEDCDGYLLSSYFNNSQADLDVKLMNLSTIHESLYTTSEVATLRTLEKFLLQLLQQKNFYGNLTPFGKLLAFINLSFLKRHITLLDSLYSHPEMSVIRSVLANSKGQIEKTLNASAGIDGNKLTNEETLSVFTQIMNKTSRDKGEISSLTNTLKTKQSSSAVRNNKNRLTVIDTLSGMYKPGGEPHFPRFVCGSVDRSLVVASETISIPFEKSDKRNVHVQFEKFNNEHCKDWPLTTKLPQNISEGTFVQVAPLKHSSLMSWKAGIVVSISSGQLMIKVPNESKERMYILRNFVPPNVPIIKLEKGHWRLMPRELDVKRDLYVGSCLSLLDLADCDESVDVVVINMFFSSENSPIAPVKLPSDETNFQHSGTAGATGGASGDSGSLQLTHRTDQDRVNSDRDDNILDEIMEDTEPSDIETVAKTQHETDFRMCSCNGYTLRVFEGRRTGIPERILVHNLHDKKEHVLNVAELRGFKLNYDLHAHFDGPTGNTQFPNSVWVVPRDISFLGDTLATKDSQKPGYSWLFKPAYCLVMFPFNRNIDTLQDLFRLIPFLHPELNYLALCAGLWSLRNKPETRDREAVSYTRSQKAAIRDLTSNDVVSEVCLDLARCPFSLTRRLYGCLPVISLWITMDLYDPDSDKPPSIPNNIKVPKPTECETCSGLVLSKTGMVKVISNKYTQILAKKLAKKSRDSGTNHPSLETLPHLDSETSKKGSKDSSAADDKVRSGEAVEKDGNDSSKDLSFDTDTSSKPNEESNFNTQGSSTSFNGSDVSGSYSSASAFNTSDANLYSSTNVNTNFTSGSSTSSTSVSTTNAITRNTSTDNTNDTDVSYSNANFNVSVSNTSAYAGSNLTNGSGVGGRAESAGRPQPKLEPVDSGREHSCKRPEGPEKLAESNPEQLNEESTLRRDMEELSKSLNANTEHSVLNNLKQELNAHKTQESSIFSAIFSPEAEYDVTPVLIDLERAEEWVKRVQTLANSRWRVTKEFTASYTVDDEISLLTMSPTTSANKPNTDFIIQLAGVMSNIKKGRDMPIDPSLVYKLYQLSEECSSTTEGALLTGWSSYIFNEQKSQMDLLLSSSLHNPRPSINYSNSLRKDKENQYANMCPMNVNCPRGSSCPCATGAMVTCPFTGCNNAVVNQNSYANVQSTFSKNFTSPGKGNAMANTAFQKCPLDLSSNYSRLFNNNPILTDLSNFYKRKRDDDIKKLAAFNKLQKNNQVSGSIMPKLGLQADVNLLKNMNKSSDKDNPFINDPFDFCKFTDKPQRKKFISSLQWDDDVEF